MTDVVKIAKECRKTLTAEIAKLDKFLAMAEKLMKYNQLESGKASEADDEEVTELTSPTKAGLYSAGVAANGADVKA
jgi:hypothetical protein